MVDANWVSARVRGRLHIVSAGLGVVAADERIPNYDATISGRVNWLAAELRRGCYGPSEWWEALCGAQGRAGVLSDLLGGDGGEIKLIALPASYLEMVSADMSTLPEEALKSIRLFTSPLGRRLLPEALKNCALPYDERLEMLKGFAGTQADFPQRAMRHFVSRLMDPRQGADSARSAVMAALRECDEPSRPTRARLSDPEIKVLLRKNWADGKGRSSFLLAQLRRGLGVACEQGRFRELWREVRAEMLMSAQEK